MECDQISLSTRFSSESSEFNSGELGDIIYFLIGQEFNEATLDNMNTILMSFHLYTSVYCLLTTLDARFWHLCCDSSICPKDKFKFIRSLAKLLDRWLEDPYAQSYNIPPDFLDLKRLLFLVSQWLRVFAPSFQTPSRKTSRSKDMSQGQLIMKARNCVSSMTPSNKLELAQTIEAIANKVNAKSDQFHITAGLFKEVNCDRDVSSAVPGLKISAPPREDSMYTFSPRHVAEQLTLYDAELFLKVIPSECLNYVRHRSAPTVDSTIQLFNRIYGLVLTSIIDADQMKSSTDSPSSPALASVALSMVSMPLHDGCSKSHVLSSSLNRSSSKHLDSSPPASDVILRAEMLAKWISIAAELRELRSFSAFTAVMTALQCYAICTLHKTWHCVERYYPTKNEAFHELSELLNLTDNKKYARELLDHMYSSCEIGRLQDARHSTISNLFRRKNGVTVSSSSPSKDTWRILRYRQKYEESALNAVGTIPYLGIFLNDLAMLHESAPDRLPHPAPMKLRRPTSGINLAAMDRALPSHQRSVSTAGLYNHSTCKSNQPTTYNQHHLKQEQPEPVLTAPLVASEVSRRPPRRRRNNESADSGTGSVFSDVSTRKPPIPVVVDRRSRTEAANDKDSLSSTTPTSSGIVLPREKRSRQVNETRKPPGSSRPSSSPVKAAIKTTAAAVTKQRQRVREGSLPRSAVCTEGSGEGAIINFRKHRREYKVLAKLMDLQVAAARFKIHEDPAFRQWFNGLQLLSESGACQKAKELEPRPPIWKDRRRKMSGSVEVLFTGNNSDEHSSNPFPSPISTTLSQPPPTSPRSANSSNGHDGCLDEHRSRIVSFKNAIKRSAATLQHRSSSADRLTHTSVRMSLSRVHDRLSSIKNEINTSTHHPRSLSRRSAEPVPEISGF